MRFSEDMEVTQRRRVSIFKGQGVGQGVGQGAGQGVVLVSLVCWCVCPVAGQGERGNPSRPTHHLFAVAKTSKRLANSLPEAAVVHPVPQLLSRVSCKEKFGRALGSPAGPGRLPAGFHSSAACKFSQNTACCELQAYKGELFCKGGAGPIASWVRMASSKICTILDWRNCFGIFCCEFSLV